MAFSQIIAASSPIATASLMSMTPSPLDGYSVVSSVVMNLRAGDGAPLSIISQQVQAFQVSLSLATFFCSTVFGMMLFAAASLMPGFAALQEDAAFLQAFQEIDKQFQKGHPLLMIPWFGSLFSMLSAFKFGRRVLLAEWNGTASGETGMQLLHWLKRPLWLKVATLLFVAGHISTIALNLPLNNRLQSLGDVSKLSSQQASLERLRFEKPWVRANWFRVVCFGISSAYLAALSVFGKIGA